MTGDNKDSWYAASSRFSRADDAKYHGLAPADWPTRDEMADVFGTAIVAACRSVLNTSSPVRTIGDVCVEHVGPGAVAPARGNK